jgi:hypothetical protein
MATTCESGPWPVCDPAHKNSSEAVLLSMHIYIYIYIGDGHASICDPFFDRSLSQNYARD